MMEDRRSIDELKELGEGKLVPEHIASLFRRAFTEFGSQSLWNRRPSEHTTIGQAPVVAESLRCEGKMKSRPLTIKIEEACRAAL